MTCPSCRAELDVSEFQTFERIACPACEHEIRVPARLGEFLLKEELGRGAMGCVFLALDESLDREVALKVMRREFGEDIEMLDTLQTEAQAMATLNHRNVVHVYSFGKQADQPYFVMELLDGERLDQMMAGGTQINEVRALEIMVDVAEGLAAAHAIGMTHGDIKPANILMDREGVAKVVDFGLARFADPDREIEVWGTPFYIAPEKARKKGEDARSDQYSLGATMFHALAGEPPYQGKDPTRVVIAALKTETPNLSTIREDLQAETCDVIYRMMQKDPAERFQEFEELSAALRHALKTARDAEEQRRIEAEEAQKVKPKSTLLPILLVTVSLLLVGVVATVILQSRKPETPATKYEGRTAEQPLTRREVRNLTEAVSAFVDGRTKDMVQSLKSAGMYIPPEHEAVAWWHLLGGVIAGQAGAVEVAREHFELARDQDPIVFQSGGTPAEDPRFLASILLNEPLDLNAVEERLKLGRPDFQHLGSAILGLRLKEKGQKEEAEKRIAVYTSASLGTIEWTYLLKPVFGGRSIDESERAKRDTTAAVTQELLAISEETDPTPEAPATPAPAAREVQAPAPMPSASLRTPQGQPGISVIESLRAGDGRVLPRSEAKAAWQNVAGEWRLPIAATQVIPSAEGLLPRKGAAFTIAVQSRFGPEVFPSRGGNTQMDATLFFLGTGFHSPDNCTGMWVGARKGAGNKAPRLSVMLQNGTRNIRTWEFPLNGLGLQDGKPHTVALAWQGRDAENGSRKADMSLFLMVDQKVLFLERIQNGITEWGGPTKGAWMAFSVGRCSSAHGGGKPGQYTRAPHVHVAGPKAAAVWANRVNADEISRYFGSK